jgi:hypothetical protein
LRVLFRKVHDFLSFRINTTDTYIPNFKSDPKSKAVALTLLLLTSLR